MIKITVFLLSVHAATCGSTHAQVGSIHGENNGTEHKILCPDGGAITGINYRSSHVIHQIGFICTSSKGNVTFGPYGRRDGNLGSIHCPPGHYISSFHGKSRTRLNYLGIRCRHVSDIDAEGTLGGESEKENGTNFDELTLSNGSRPVSVTVWARKNVGLYGIQITYVNIPVANAFTWKYEEVMGERHGYKGDGATPYNFTCPKDGVITTIHYYSTDIIVAIAFKCKSSLGITWEGPFGDFMRGRFHSRECYGSQHILYIQGSHNDHNLIDLYVVCEVDGIGPEQEIVSTKRNKDNIKYFSDEKYAKKGKRPIEISIWYTSSSVDAIQIKYGNVPVEYNCKLSEIQVLYQEIKTIEDDFEVIGISSGSTCSTSEQQLSLSIVHGESNSVIKAHGDGNDDTDFLHIDSDISSGGEIVPGIKLLFLRGVTWPIIKKTTSTDQSTSTDTSRGTEYTLSTTVNYQGPGAAIVLGYRIVYSIYQPGVLATYNYICEGGSKEPIPKVINLSHTRFGNVFFHDHQFTFKSNDECVLERSRRECVSNIKINNVISHTKLLETQFYNCFLKNLSTTTAG